MNWLAILVGLFVLAVIGLVGWVRFAPTDPARWHVDPLTAPDPATPNFARIRPGEVTLDAPDAAARLRAAMETLPRTRLIAESEDEGMMTFVTRSRLMGFPDYTTIRLTEDGTSFAALARSRFGQSDMGVNAERLQALKAALQ